MIKKLFLRAKELLLHISKRWDNELSVSEENAVTFAHCNINPEPEVFVEGTRHYSLEYCLAHSGESVNRRFREDRPDSEDLAIAAMVEEHSTKVPLVLYRGVHEDIFAQMKKNAVGVPGADLCEKAFMQTSLVKGHEMRTKIRLRIYVPAGYPVVYLGNVNEELSYYEVVIARGAKLKIVSYDGVYWNCILLPWDTRGESGRTGTYRITNYYRVIDPRSIREMNAPEFNESHYSSEDEYRSFLESVQPLIEEYARDGKIHSIEYRTMEEEERHTFTYFHNAFLDAGMHINVRKHPDNTYSVTSNGRHRMYVARKYGLKLIVHVGEEWFPH